jgi:hypothetical protein
VGRRREAARPLVGGILDGQREGAASLDRLGPEACAAADRPSRELLGAPSIRVVARLVPLVSDEIEYRFYRPRDDDLAGDVCHDGYPPLR